MDLPYLTGDLPGVGGRIRERPDDFRVDEQPLYAACGEGSHVYFRIEKRGIPTSAAVDRIATYMDVRPSEIGLAGLKDAHAVTTQWLSLEHANTDRLAALGAKDVRVLEISRHTNKLRPGHLAANRFAIRIRGTSAGELSVATAVMDILRRRGVPNYFGPQRFGARGDTADLGRALVARDGAEFVATLIGRPRPDDPPDCRAARAAFDAGDFDAARRHWPRHYANERRALAAYKRKKRPGDAMRAVDKRMMRFYVSAFQSDLFNRVLARRIDSIDRILPGDLAQIGNGAVFSVEDVDTEQVRCDAHEISPTGPIIGYRGSVAGADGGQIERTVLAEADVDRDAFRALGPLKAKGGRRPLRYCLDSAAIDAGSDDAGPYLEIRFDAPSGCYATALLRELMKQ